MNTVNIKINGMDYNLKGEEKEEYLHKIALYVDKKIKTMMDYNDKLSTTQAAVLTSLNIADEYFKNKEAQNEYEEILEKHIKNEKSLKEEIESLNRQLKHLNQYNDELLEKVRNSSNEDYIKLKDEEIIKLNKELRVINETSEKHLQDKNVLIEENKKLKFDLQTAKYKVIDMENRLIENQVDLAKAKKGKNNLAPLLNFELKTSERK